MSGSDFDPNAWGVFNPLSPEFHQAENIFHQNLSKSNFHWRQAVVIIASMIGGLFFIVGAFPVFCWTAKWLKIEEDENISRVNYAVREYFPEQTTIEETKVELPETPPTISKAAEIGFGKAEWEKYFGDPGEVPELPGYIDSLLMEESEAFPGKKVWETHLLVLVPEKINGQPLSLSYLEGLAQNPLNDGHPSELIYFSLPQDTDQSTSKSHWVLVTNDIIQGTLGADYGTQSDLIKKLNQSGHSYQIPTARDMAVCFASHYAKSKESFSLGTFCENITSGGIKNEGRIAIKISQNAANVSFFSARLTRLIGQKDYGMAASMEIT